MPFGRKVRNQQIAHRCCQKKARHVHHSVNQGKSKLFQCWTNSVKIGKTMEHPVDHVLAVVEKADESDKKNLQKALSSEIFCQFLLSFCKKSSLMNVKM